jgi:hypothetical protein
LLKSNCANISIVNGTNAEADLRKAKSDSRVQVLPKKIGPLYQINYEEVEGPSWDCGIRGNVATIGFAKAKHPEPCLGHELLHVILHNEGFRQIRRGFSVTIPDAMRLIKALNNELQHHKMFPKFLDAKFPANRFYNESDAQIHAHVQKDIGELNDNPLNAAVLTLTIVAPGGILTTANQADYLADLSKINSGKFGSCVTQVTEAIAAWRNNASLNTESTIVAIFKAIKHPSRSWFGYTEDAVPPDEGFFTDEKFVVDPP